jgi:hypothetical protein
MTILSVMQPSFLPWIGYFNLIKESKYFIFYDDVQYDKNGWRNRNKIKLNSKIEWLTVPVITKNRFRQLIMDVEIDNQKDWKKNHLSKLHHAYSKYKHYSFLLPLLLEGYKTDTNKLSDLNISFIKIFLAALGIESEIYKSSELSIQGDKNSRLINFCLNLGADEYLSGDSASEYLNIKKFKENSIHVRYQNYQHPKYHQNHFGQFYPYLSIVDLLASHGSDSAELI